MEHITTPSYTSVRPTAVTLGNFDGVHMGHKCLMHAVKSRAESDGLQSVVFSFNPHPIEYFESISGSNKLKFISLPNEKKQLIDEYGIEIFFECPFSAEFASMDAEEFAEKFLFKNLMCKYLAAGENYRFGKNRTGDINLLKQIGKKYNADVDAVPMITYDSQRVSSTSVRELIQSGYGIVDAGTLLGRPYSLSGTVVTGKKLGRTIGFPTLNIFAPKQKVIPMNGVYATTAYLCGKRYMSVTNIGTNPTVGGTYQTIETHIFDFSEDMYGHEITVEFYKFLRGEVKFNGVNSLAQQLSRDVANAKEFFSKSAQHAEILKQCSLF